MLFFVDKLTKILTLIIWNVALIVAVASTESTSTAEAVLDISDIIKYLDIINIALFWN